MAGTKQVIQIDVTWDGYSTLKLESIIAWLAQTSLNNKGLGIKRLEVKEVKK